MQFVNNLTTTNLVALSLKSPYNTHRHVYETTKTVRIVLIFHQNHGERKPLSYSCQKIYGGGEVFHKFSQYQIPTFRRLCRRTDQAYLHLRNKFIFLES